MARLKEDGEFEVEGSVKMWLPLEPEEGESLTVKTGQDIQPLQVWVNVNVDAEEWSVGSVVIKGRILKKDDTPGERWAERNYWGPHDDGHFEGPEWVVEILNREIPRRLSGRTKAREGMQEPVSSVEISRRVRRSSQRAAFDMALDVLLMRENLDGTEWAIEQLREGAAAADRVVEASETTNLDARLTGQALRVAADELEKALDKRAAELAVGNREH
jgi:hypothetical protein